MVYGSRRHIVLLPCARQPDKQFLQGKNLGVTGCEGNTHSPNLRYRYISEQIYNLVSPSKASLIRLTSMNKPTHNTTHIGMQQAWFLRNSRQKAGSHCPNFLLPMATIPASLERAISATTPRPSSGLITAFRSKYASPHRICNSRVHERYAHMLKHVQS